MKLRVWKDGTIAIHEIVERATRAELERAISEIGARYANLVGGHLFMVEVDFLDEPDPARRVFRFGADPTLIDIPMSPDSDIS